MLDAQRLGMLRYHAIPRSHISQEMPSLMSRRRFAYGHDFARQAHTPCVIRRDFSAL